MTTFDEFYIIPPGEFILEFLRLQVMSLEVFFSADLTLEKEIAIRYSKDNPYQTFVCWRYGEENRFSWWGK